MSVFVYLENVLCDSAAVRWILSLGAKLFNPLVSLSTPAGRTID